MPSSIIEAIRNGLWDFEPMEVARSTFPPTDAVPGTKEKLQVLAERVKQGLPLWHPADRLNYERENDRK